MNRGLGMLLTLLCCASAAQAQTAVGDSLWQLGRHAEARAAYERAIAEDRNAVRANFRLAQLAAWGQNIDSALVLLRQARERVPKDQDLLFTEATYLGWGRRYDDAIVRYDSILAAPTIDVAPVRVARARTLSWAGRLGDAATAYAEILAADPSDRDARYGLAQVRSWSGDLAGATRAYQQLLADDPAEPRVLIGLAAIKLWQGRPGSAQRLLDRAAVRAPDDADLASLRRAARQAAGTRIGLGHNYSEDTDRNVNRWSTVRLQQMLGDAQVSLTAGRLNATDPARNSQREMLEAGTALPLGPATLSGSVGLRQLQPVARFGDIAAGTERDLVTWRAALSLPLGSRLTANVGASAWPFDEIASLLGAELDIDQVEGSLEWRVLRSLSLAIGASQLSFSDGNTRRGGNVRITQRLPGGFSVGAYGIGFDFAERATVYFSPPDFRAAELTAGWGRETERWGAGLSGGYGRQRVRSGLPQQELWHIDARVNARLTSFLNLEAFAGRSTSAAASAVGAYRYDIIGLSLNVRPF